MNHVVQNQTNRLSQFSLIACWAYIFFAVVPHATAGKHLASAFVLIAFIALLVRKQIRWPELNWLNVSVFSVLGLALISAALSPWAAESLNQFRKEGLLFFLVFMVLTQQRALSSRQTLVGTMSALILGFAVKEILAIWAGVTNGFQFSRYEVGEGHLPKYLEFFSVDTPHYLPFLLAPLCFWPMKLWQRLLLSVFGVAAVIIVLVSGARTAFILAILVASIVLIYRYGAKEFLFITLIALIAIGVNQLSVNPQNTIIERYKSLFSTKTYLYGNDESVSERYAIINGIWEISQNRLWLGHGLGWKKLPRVAELNGDMDRWRKSQKPIDKNVLNYFCLGEGVVNAHNIYVGFVFENGLLGLVAYLSMMLAVFVGMIKVLRKAKEYPVQKGIAFAGAVYVVVCAVAGFSGGDWLPVTMLVAVVCLSLLQSNRSECC